MSTFRKILFAQRPISTSSTVVDIAAITGISFLNSLRQDVDGEVGLIFIVGSYPIVVTQLGRYVESGHSKTHRMTLNTLANNACGITLRSGLMDCNGAATGDYAYASVSSISMYAGQSYTVLSMESTTAGFDTWRDITNIYKTSDFSLIRPAYSIGGVCQQPATDDASYVPVNFKYHLVDFNSSCTPSYANLGGTGQRSTPIMIVVSNTGSIPAMLGGGGESAWTDGDTFSAGHGFFNGGPASGSWLKFDFGNNNKVIINEAKFYQTTNDTQGTWIWQASNDNSNWTNLGSSFALGGVAAGQTLTSMSANTTRYRYYLMSGVSGTTNANPWLNEMEFQICL